VQLILNVQLKGGQFEGKVRVVLQSYLVFPSAGTTFELAQCWLHNNYKQQAV
jgi:hypothetical protein